MPRGKKLPKWPVKLGDPDWPTCKCGCGTPVGAYHRGIAEKGILSGQPHEYARGHSGRMHPRDGDKKRCPTCETFKPLSEFGPRGPGKSLKHECRECAGKTHAKWRQENPEVVRAYKERNREANAEKSRRWREEHPGYARQRGYTGTQTRRARQAELFVEYIDPLIVLEMDDGVCGICGEDVDPFDFVIDHVVPISRGGLHAYTNVRVAHAPCNWRKFDKLDHEM